MPLAILFDFIDFLVYKLLINVSLKIDSVVIFLVGVSKEARCSALGGYEFRLCLWSKSISLLSSMPSKLSPSISGLPDEGVCTLEL